MFVSSFARSLHVTANVQDDHTCETITRRSCLLISICCECAWASVASVASVHSSSVAETENALHFSEQYLLNCRTNEGDLFQGRRAPSTSHGIFRLRCGETVAKLSKRLAATSTAILFCLLCCFRFPLSFHFSVQKHWYSDIYWEQKKV